MSETTHTGPAAAKLVSAVQEDLGEIADLLGRALEKIRAVELAGKGVNGLPATLKAKGNEVEQTIKVLTEEHARIAKKMLHDPKRAVEIHEHVDSALAANVAAARSA